ncbi:MAG TPA: N-acetylglucosamine-6-phosphate deacetylase [Acidobacteriaceae bacterium]|nr:N-acetylglucosamine-6-phosphate deacetylase [Acidobacteriaceae bacterium]
MTSVVTARRLLQSDGVLEYPVLVIEDGSITSIRSRASDALPADLPPGSVVHSFPDAMLAPSYIDIHIHGAAGHDVMEGTPQAMRAISAFLASRGVGAFFPTTVTSPVEETLGALERLAGEIERGAPDGAMPLGIHLEGPFLSHAKRGVHPAALLRQPSIPLFDRFWQAARGHIRLMTIAPELPDAAELIEHASVLGVKCSLGHSAASATEADAGVRAGARSATHTFNAMRAIDHRDPGITAYVLDCGDLFADIICDGIHIDPMMVRLFFKAKGGRRAILITDAISATGMPDGRYRLGDLDVNVEQGRCTLAEPPEGVLAGSVLTLDQAVRNFADFTGAGLPASIGLATRNPAELLGMDDRWGVLAEGREANIAVLSGHGEILESFRAGRPLSPGRQQAYAAGAS